jgi:RNA 2',3'-cyclic 3'-phosphodiesterase
MIRLFIALKIPVEIKEQIITLRKTVYDTPGKMRWETIDKMHLTLKFIGDVPEDKVEDIKESLGFIEDYEKFKCIFTGFGVFSSHGRPKILWADFKSDNNLIELASRLNEHFKNFSIPAEERRYKAHLTLLRIKDKVDKKFVERFNNYRVNEIPFVVDEAALIKSELLPSGSVYTELKNFKLK